MKKCELTKRVKYHRWQSPVIGYWGWKKYSLVFCKTCRHIMGKRIETSSRNDLSTSGEDRS